MKNNSYEKLQNWSSSMEYFMKYSLYWITSVNKGFIIGIVELRSTTDFPSPVSTQNENSSKDLLI